VRHQGVREGSKFFCWSRAGTSGDVISVIIRLPSRCVVTQLYVVVISRRRFAAPRRCRLVLLVRWSCVRDPCAADQRHTTDRTLRRPTPSTYAAAAAAAASLQLISALVSRLSTASKRHPAQASNCALHHISVSPTRFLFFAFRPSARRPITLSFHPRSRDKLPVRVRFVHWRRDIHRSVAMAAVAVVEQRERQTETKRAGNWHPCVCVCVCVCVCWRVNADAAYRSTTTFSWRLSAICKLSETRAHNDRFCATFNASIVIVFHSTVL